MINKVGRPKLADKETKKGAIIYCALSLSICVIFSLFGINYIKSNSIIGYKADLSSFVCNISFGKKYNKDILNVKCGQDIKQIVINNNVINKTKDNIDTYIYIGEENKIKYYYINYSGVKSNIKEIEVPNK